MGRPSVQYARSGDVHVAYEVIGEGPVDVVFVWGGISHAEIGWEHPPTAWFFQRLARSCRLIILDKRGTGLSDRVPFSSIEDRMDDIRAVMDAVGSERAVVFGESEAAGLATVFAATYPERVAGLVLYAPLVRVIRTLDFPWAHSSEAFERYVATSMRHWGDGTMMSLHSPSTAHEALARDHWGRLERTAMSPGGFADHMHVLAELDIRPVLPLVQVPTLVLHRTGDPTVPIGQGRYLAAQIPNATLVELDGSDHYPMVGDARAILAATAGFISGDASTVDGDPERVLATVLFTDIVHSTETLAAVGDRRWHEVIDRHFDTTTREVERHRGRLVRTAGDGTLATFDGPARAIRCAGAIKEASQRIGLAIRAGLHAGEVELQGSDVMGIAVHMASRVESLAEPGEVLVSRTVVDLVAGSGLQFLDRGVHTLRGVPGEFRLYAVAS